MTTPKNLKTNLLKVIERLERYNKKYPESKLDMSESEVNEFGHVCGTTHCFGGAYAVECLDEGLLSGKIDFRDGADLMAQHLGFSQRGDFKNWAYKNRKLWDNNLGYGVFSDERAFRSANRPNGAEIFQHITDHLREVHQRL